jgi:hypothetical protein
MDLCSSAEGETIPQAGTRLRAKTKYFGVQAGNDYFIG